MLTGHENLWQTHVYPGRATGGLLPTDAGSSVTFRHPSVGLDVTEGYRPYHSGGMQPRTEQAVCQVLGPLYPTMEGEDSFLLWRCAHVQEKLWANSEGK